MKTNRVAGVLLASSITMVISGCIPLTSEVTCENGEPVPPSEKAVAGVGIVFQVSEGFPDASAAIAQDPILKQSFPDLKSETPTAVSVVVADGNPNQVFKSWVSLGEGEIELDLKQKNDRLQTKLRSVYGCELSQNQSMQRLQNYTDLIGALDLAAAGLNEVDGEKSIFVFANGLQTSGQVDFSKDFPETPEAVERVISALEGVNALPDLNGANVHWTGMGVTADTIEPLNQQSKNMLELFWTRLIIASNGQPPAQYAAGSLGNTPPEFAAPEKQIKGIENLCLFTIGESSGFAFKPDSSEFLNIQAALQGAQQIAKEITDSNCNVGVRVTGYTASGISKSKYKPASDTALSRARAQAFADLLSENGVDVREVVGGGKGPVEDWDESGNFVEALGKLNRIVKVEAID